MQERQFSPFESDTLSPAERQALKRVRGRRARAFLVCFGTGVLTLFAVGCPEPGDLQNPNAYPAPTPTAGTAATGGGTSGGSGGGTSTGSACETACVKTIFQTSPALCKLCHNNTMPTPLKSAMLDIASDGFTARLKNVPATHTDLGMGMSAADCPTGDKLIDTATPANSWLLKKIKGEQGNCGAVMPSNPLAADQKACIEAYVACVAAEGP